MYLYVHVYILLDLIHLFYLYFKIKNLIVEQLISIKSVKSFNSRSLNIGSRVHRTVL